MELILEGNLEVASWLNSQLNFRLGQTCTGGDVRSGAGDVCGVDEISRR